MHAYSQCIPGSQKKRREPGYEANEDLAKKSVFIHHI